MKCVPNAYYGKHYIPKLIGSDLKNMFLFSDAQKVIVKQEIFS
jgi:hypothetical protein